MQKSEQINELATALAKAQGEIENASKNSNNPAYKSKYADLAEVLNTVRPVFSAHGLSITQFPSFADGLASVETVLMHSSGQWMSGLASAGVTKQDAQGVGSAITYLRRYSLAAVAGIAQEDDDAQAAIGGSAGKAKTKPAPAPDDMPESVAAPAKWMAEMELKIRSAESAAKLDEIRGYINTKRLPADQLDKLKAVCTEIETALTVENA